MPMKNPPHVGGLIRREVIEPLGLTVTEAAKVLQVGRQALSALLNERVSLTPDMALRVEKAFGPKMEHLMRMQLAYDLAQATRRGQSPESAMLRRKESARSEAGMRPCFQRRRCGLVVDRVRSRPQKAART